MESSSRFMQSTNNKQLLLEQLRKEQAEYGEDTIHWALLQDKINHIIAQNYLHYVNR